MEPCGGRALVCPRFLFFFLFFHLSHRATVDFLHSCNAVNRVNVTPPLKHAGLMDTHIKSYTGMYMFYVDIYSDSCHLHPMTSKMSWCSFASCLRVYLIEQENLHCCRYLIVCVTYARGNRPSSNSHNVHYRPPHETGFVESDSPPPSKNKNCTNHGYDLTFSFIKF